MSPRLPSFARPVWRSVRAIAADRYRRFKIASGDDRPLPSFVIIGAYKCGTTSLFEHLSRHPQIARPDKKEINFFTRHFDSGLPWYRSHFPRIPRDERLAPGNPSGRITFEATPAYLPHARAARRASKAMPDAKLIVLLRQPAERTVSHYLFRPTHGASQDALRDTIRAEISRIRGREQALINATEDGQADTQYVLKSVYVHQLANWLRYFPRHQVMVLSAEGLFENPALWVRRICGFVGVEERDLGPFPAFRKSDRLQADPVIVAELEDYFKSLNEELFTLLGERLWP